MRECKAAAAYLEAVQQQIRWKRARPAVALELQQHLEDQQAALLQEGYGPEQAQRLAVAEMGDPVAVGIKLDRIHRPRAQWGALLLTLALAIGGGLLRVLLTSGSEQAASPARAISALLLGTACLLGAYFLDCSRLFSHPRAVYGAVLATGVLALLLSPVRYGTHYYAHYMTVCYPTVYAVWLYGWRGRGWTGLFAAIAGGVPLVIVCLAIPNLSAVGTLLVCGFILLLCAIWADWFGVSRGKAVLAACLSAAACAAAGLMMLLHGRTGAYLLRRMGQFIHPEQDPLGFGWQALSIRSALAASRWLGRGSEQGLPAAFEEFVPEWGHDALLTTIIYKLGWLPFLALMLAAAGFAAWLLKKCLQQKNQAGRLLALSVVLSLGMRAAVSLLMNLGIVIISAQFPLLIGNLQTVIDMGLIGLALSVFRDESLPCLHAVKAAAKSPLGSKMRRAIGKRLTEIGKELSER